MSVHRPGSLSTSQDARLRISTSATRAPPKRQVRITVIAANPWAVKPAAIGTAAPSALADGVSRRSHRTSAFSVTFAQAVPHAAVLPSVDVVVSHAGLGTVTAALAHGVPLVCHPFGRDQHLNAQRVEAVGRGGRGDVSRRARRRGPTGRRRERVPHTRASKRNSARWRAVPPRPPNSCSRWPAEQRSSFGLACSGPSSRRRTRSPVGRSSGRRSWDD